VSDTSLLWRWQQPGLGKSLLVAGGGKGRENTDCLARAAPSAAGGGFDAVLEEVGEVRVARTRVKIHFRVVVWSLVFVGNHHSDGSAQGVSELGAGVNLDAVFFIAGSGERGLTRTTPRELRLDVRFSERQSRGDAVDNAAHGAAVGFAVAGRPSIGVNVDGDESNRRSDAEVRAEGRHYLVVVAGGWRTDPGGEGRGEEEVRSG
jgi:hypothetical protein